MPFFAFSWIFRRSDVLVQTKIVQANFVNSWKYEFFFKVFDKTISSHETSEQFWKQNTLFREKTADNCIVNNLDEIFTMMALNVVWQMVASKRFNYHEDGMKKLLHNQQGTIDILRNQLWRGWGGGGKKITVFSKLFELCKKSDYGTATARAIQAWMSAGNSYPHESCWWKIIP